MYDCMCEYHELPYRDEVAWVSDIILSHLYEYGIFTVKKEVKQKLLLKPCPAEPGYVLPLQTV